MTAPRRRYTRAILLALVFLLLGAGHVQAQEPAPNKVYLPVVSHHWRTRTDAVFMEDPGIYWIIRHVAPDVPAFARSSAYHTQNGVTQYTSANSAEADQWYYTPRVQEWPGVVRVNHWVRISGMLYYVQTFRPFEMEQLFGPIENLDVLIYPPAP